MDRRGLWRGRPRRGMIPGRAMHNNPRMLRPQAPPPNNWIGPNGPCRPGIPAKVNVTNGTNVLPPSFNINELFQKLVAAGIVTTVQENQSAISTQQPVISAPAVSSHIAPPVIIKKDSVPALIPVTFDKPGTLKM